MSEYYAKNKKEILVQQKVRRDSLTPQEKEFVLKKRKKFRDSNKDKVSRQKHESYLRNKQKNLNRSSAWYQRNKERQNNSHRVWKEKNRDKHRAYKRSYNRNSYQNDINLRISSCLRARLRAALKNNSKKGSAVSDLGCSIPFLKKYLESKFYKDMSWDNFGLGKGKWQIDHIKPLCSFDLSRREEFLEACHYTNLQPLMYEDHCQKSSKERKCV